MKKLLAILLAAILALGVCSAFAEAIAAACGDERFCRIDSVHGVPMLFACGKHHVLSTPMEEFLRRLSQDMERYGQRAADAEKSGGMDWKALSHAVRAIRQNMELLECGRVTFPLRCREELLRIKTGQAGWDEVEKSILEGLAALEALRASSPYGAGPDISRARQAVLACYGLEDRHD